MIPDPLKRSAQWRKWYYSGGREKKQRYRLKNKDKIRLQTADYRLRAKDKIKEKNNIYNAKNRKVICAKASVVRAGDRMVCLVHYSGWPPHCACCGELNTEFLAIDHINGDGAAHRRRFGRGNSIYRWLINNRFPSSFRILCHNCNMSRGTYGYCPHDITQ